MDLNGFKINQNMGRIDFGNYRPDWIYITKCPLDTDPADVFDCAQDDPALIEEIDKFLKARPDLTVEERRKNCVRTNLNYYVALYGREFAQMLK